MYYKGNAVDLGLETGNLVLPTIATREQVCSGERSFVLHRGSRLLSPHKGTMARGKSRVQKGISPDKTVATQNFERPAIVTAM